MNTNERNELGLVKWFDQEKGFGVIATLKKGEIFIHGSKIRGVAILAGGEPVVFETDYNQDKKRTEAKNCRLANQIEDIKLIWNFFGLDDTIIYEKSDNYIGKRNKYKGYLRGKTGIQIYRSVGREVFLKFIKDTFHEAPTEVFFNNYCSVINVVIKNVEKDDAEVYLNELYSFFQKNQTEEIVFQVWKSKTYEWLNTFNPKDLPLTQNLFERYFEEFSVEELKRIENEFDFYEDLKKKYIDFQLGNLENREFSDLPKIFEILVQVNPELKELLIGKLTPIYISHFEKDINNIIEEKKGAEYRLRDLSDFLKYGLKSTPKPLMKEIEKYAYGKVNESIDIELRIYSWFEGLVDKPISQEIFKYLLDFSKDSNEVLKIFIRIDFEEQDEFLKMFYEKEGSEKAYTLLINYLNKINNSIGYNKPKDFLFNKEYLAKINLNENAKILLKNFNDFIEKNVEQREKDLLYIKGFYPTISENYVRNNIESFSYELIRNIFIQFKDSPELIKEWFNILKRIDNKSLSELISITLSVLDEENFKEVDQNLREELNGNDYFELWKKGHVKITPEKNIIESLNETHESFEQLISSVKYSSSPKKGTVKVLLKLLVQRSNISTFHEFLFATNCFWAILELDPEKATEIEKLQIPFYNLLLWYHKDFDTFNLEVFKQKFIYFNPEDQALLFKKLFSEIAKSKVKITIKDLKEINRFDLDLFETHILHHKDVPVDISTDLVIQILESLDSKSEIISQSEILSMVLNDLKFNRSKRFKFEKYFEECGGRMVGEFNWKQSEGKIQKIPFGQNQFYFSISFPRILSNSHGREEWNSSFKELVEKVKRLPGRKWNPEAEHWGVPSKYEIEVIEFAKREKFFLDFEGSNYKNNPHFVEYTREDIPDGIQYCEGRVANKLDNYLNKEFFWCAGDKCFQRCEKIHSPEQWRNYKLLDFCKILGYNLDETNRMGDFIPNGIYYRFISLVNRFNRMLERLYCEECGEILHPVDTSHYASRTVVRFHCVNSNCSCKGDEIYLNHCLNGKCNAIIDSRRSKKCPHDLFICEKCGSCCSHNQMARRLSALEEVGGYVHPQLRRIVNEKLGHLERAEYFCYKCGSEMSEIEEETFHCQPCNVYYHTEKYNFKREHKHLRKPK
ncbi:cold-shock protein [Algoriphagus formosus]|uniref:cold-shock protein n=1 Tax=Algoriphagus formosus TaxID=2007308 RepID=UPI000C285E4E|nr:cold shock domain-containing protein [Algoriphagus formosus]